MQNKRIVELAIKGLEAERARIDQELSELRQETGSTTVAENRSPAPTRKASPRRKMSAAARKRISEAMKRSHAVRKAAAKK